MPVPTQTTVASFRRLCISRDVRDTKRTVINLALSPRANGGETVRQPQFAATSAARRSVKFSAHRRGRHLSRVTTDRDMSVGSNINETPSEEVLTLWRSAEAVCFDVDSTVCTDEGIDELAAFLGAGEKVAEWTAKAMGGGVGYREALEARLQLMEPSRRSVQAYLHAHPPLLSPGIEELVSALQANGKTVYLVSGGFRQLINPVAEKLGIPLERVFANQLLFEEEGEGLYAGFDPAEFTSEEGGKARAAKHIKAAFKHETLVMVGDGATDLEARMPGAAQIFIGYGGAQVRQAVAEGADWYVYSFSPLVEALR